MNQNFLGWKAVADYLLEQVRSQTILSKSDPQALARLNSGQLASLKAIAQSLVSVPGMVIADEVGMGKTRIAVDLVRSVIEAGGRVAILVPPGLSFQWREELKAGGVDAPRMVRSLWSYLQAWQSDSENDRAPWFDEKVVIVSHAFTNWRLGETAGSWRWGLLPELVARWRKKTTRRWPTNYGRDREACDSDAYDVVCDAAESIVTTLPDNNPLHPAYRRMTDLDDSTDWKGIWDSSAYGRSQHLRKSLENAVGIGFGMFDLVITDEAHKNRAPESGLSTLLNNVIWQSDLVRHVVLTATPVELDATQWGDILQRIGLDQKKCQQLQCIINDYTASVQRLRQCWRTSQEARANYAESARKFHQALAPYLLRRDKREDDDVKLFNTHSGRPINEYRHQREILVETKNLSSAWKQAVCAAEALSLVARQSDNAEAKRLRLTLANGHGIATLLDKIKRSDADNLQEKNDAEDPTETIDPKRSARNQWWLNTIALAFANDSHSLFHHPSIIAAVNAIEEVTASGGKVLVFGRFTTPMHALVGLLNAREMLRRIDKKQSWPQTKVHVEDWKEKVGIDDLAAVRAAHIQLGSRVDLAKLDRTLTSRYKVESERREELRKNLLDTIKRGMKKMKMAPDAMNWKLFSAFEKSAKSQDGTKADDRHPVALMSRALSELLGDSGRKFSAHDYAVGFCELIDALSDKGDDDGDDMDDDQASERWDALELRLEEEYNRPEGGFARLMNGETKHETRRVLQLAFNRDHSFPKVLVAQSMVGREGLNLHKACRTVVMLHPEWNPGVVEQQIGRVDRVGSHWSKELKDAINMDFSAEKLPRIEVRPVIFRGTYDEYNWNVLQERWDDLRAQLHGIVIPPRLVEPKNQYLADEIAAAAPNFSPSPT